jgi:hypothetical protein
MDRIDKPRGDEVEEQRLDLRGKSVAEIPLTLTAPSIDGIDDPQLHASPVAPSSPAVASDSSESRNAPPITPLIADAPPMAPEIGDRPLEDPAHRTHTLSAPLWRDFSRGGMAVETVAPDRVWRSSAMRVGWQPSCFRVAESSNHASPHAVSRSLM